MGHPRDGDVGLSRSARRPHGSRERSICLCPVFSSLLLILPNLTSNPRHLGPPPALTTAEPSRAPRGGRWGAGDADRPSRPSGGFSAVSAGHTFPPFRGLRPGVGETPFYKHPALSLFGDTAGQAEALDLHRRWSGSSPVPLCLDGGGGPTTISGFRAQRRAAQARTSGRLRPDSEACPCCASLLRRPV